MKTLEHTRPFGLQTPFASYLAYNEQGLEDLCGIGPDHVTDSIIRKLRDALKGEECPSVWVHLSWLEAVVLSIAIDPDSCASEELTSAQLRRFREVAEGFFALKLKEWPEDRPWGDNT